MAVNAIDAVWIAAAVLTTKSSKRKRLKLSNTDVCFVAKDIQELAQQITDEDVTINTIMVQATAHVDGSLCNYLVADGDMRRVSYMGEFSGNRECPETDVINEGGRIEAIRKLADITDVFEYMNRGYTDQVKNGLKHKKTGNVMTEWLISSNPKYYDVINAFENLKRIDWKQKTNVAVGDIVYIYISGTEQAIRIKSKAVKVDKSKPTIDDSKYDLSGQFDGMYGRYMELELVEILEGDVYKRTLLEPHGFSSPQSPVRVAPAVKEYLEIVQTLQHAEYMDPDKHDGSYQLVSSVVEAYTEMGDLGKVDYKDLNLLYLMCVGTWKQKIPAKKDTIEASNLPQELKDGLTLTLDSIWERANNNEYENRESGNASIGMFGTGFFSFQGKTDADSPRNFIQMCIDIWQMEDPDEILDRCAQTLTADFHGMKAASASMILHCLMPDVFPVLNSNMGSENIFEYLGTKLNRKRDIDTYIENARAVMRFRDANFTQKNYRIYDQAAWNIGKASDMTKINYLGILDYLKNNRELPYGNPEKPGLSEEQKQQFLEVKKNGQNVVAELKKIHELCSEKFGLTRCEKVSWDDGSHTKTRRYLWVPMKYDAYSGRHESISVFVEMQDENTPVFRLSLELRNDKTNIEDTKQYHKHLDLPVDEDAGLVYVAGSNELGRPKILNESQEIIKQKLANKEYDKVQICRYITAEDYPTNDDIENAILDAIEALIPYYDYVLGKVEAAEFSPSLNEYDPGISTDEYERILADETIVRRSWLDILYRLYQIGGEGSCKQVANKYGNNALHYNTNAINIAKAVAKETGCSLYKRDSGEDSYWPVLFMGKEMPTGGDGTFCYKMREPLMEAVKALEERGVFQDMGKGANEFDKNMILYGPPGTGKTYNSVVYAVAICEGKSVEEVSSEKYEGVKSRYEKLKKDGRIAFTTFHQSYGYEEFIEGIRPVMASENAELEVQNGTQLNYRVEAGVFKKFCDDAKKIEVKTNKFDFDKDAIIWKVTVRPEVREDCFENNHVRIDWGMDSEGAYGFVNDMKKGDLILTTDGSRSIINGIAVVTSDEAFELEGTDEDKTTRNVTWLATEISEDIRNINAGKMLHRMTCARVPKMEVADVVALAMNKNANLSGTELEDNKKPYVFIIDEINRGNISKIFGELITLIENTKRLGMDEQASAILPYSKEEFSVPSNVYILGTMNTADRSIALMDTALRRRFEFVEMMPDSQVLRDIGADKIVEAGIELDVAEMLDVINQRIEYLYDREHTIGHAFFTGLKKEPTVHKLGSIFKKSIIPLLQEYFYEDYSKIMLVLGDNGKSNDADKFILATEIKSNAIFRGDTSDIDIPDYAYEIQEEAFDNIMSYKEISE